LLQSFVRRKYAGERASAFFALISLSAAIAAILLLLC